MSPVEKDQGATAGSSASSRTDERRSGRQVSRALVDACVGSGTVALSSLEIPELIDAARFHRIAPLLLSTFRHTEDPGLQPLQMDRLRAVATHLQACAALDELARLLHDVEWVTFKGPVLSERAHPVPGLRTYNDVDVLVGPTSLREVCRRLGAAGWHLVDFEDMLTSADPPGEMHWVSPGGALVDLHWSMINMHSRRRLFDVPTPALLARRVPAGPGLEEQWWTLEPIDSLLHVCLHAALAGASKLVYLVDADRLSRAITDWDEVAARAVRWGVQSQVALVLGRARRVLGTPLPAGLETQLGVALPVRVLMSLTDRVTPVPDVRRSAGWARFCARAVGPTTRATTLAAARHAFRGLKERVAPRSRVGTERLLADEGSLEIFLAKVEGTHTLPV